MRLITLSIVLTLSLVGCGESSGGEAGTGGPSGSGGSAGTGGTGEFVASLTHVYDLQMLDVGGETTDICQSWVLGNEEPLYVTGVRQTNDGGWHHSNWFFVPETAYAPNYDVEGPDATREGTWKCSDRNFSEYLSAAAGGVFFAQSTQTLQELQAFPKGAALEIPPHSMIVGGTHLLNISAAPLETRMTMEVGTVPADEVEIRLTPFSFANGSLEIPYENGVTTESRWSMLCDLTETFQTVLQKDEVEYNIYYVLGHYHQWGNYFNLSFVHDDGSEELIFEIKNTIGEPIGSIIDPPMSNKGASKLEATCGFLNNTGKTLYRGLQYGEMCDFLAYTDANLKVGAGGGANTDMGQDENGRRLFATDCGPIIGIKAYRDQP